MNHSTQAQELEFSLQNPDEEVSYSVVCTYNPNSGDMEIGRHVRVPGQPAAPAWGALTSTSVRDPVLKTR